MRLFFVALLFIIGVACFLPKEVPTQAAFYKITATQIDTVLVRGYYQKRIYWVDPNKVQYFTDEDINLIIKVGDSHIALIKK